MKAMVLEDFGMELIMKDVPTPKPKNNEVLVKVKACGVCGTDLKIQNNKLQPGIVSVPHILGHEAAGEVAEIGDEVTDWKIGDRVCIYFYYTCNSCKYCLSGRSTLCGQRQRPGFELDGAYAEYVVVPASNLVAVPEHLDFVSTCVLADAGATAYHALFAKGGLKVGERLLIVGVGGLGIHAVQMARAAGAEIIVADIEDERLKISQGYGAHFTINVKQKDPYEAVMEITKGQGVDKVLNLVGTAQVFNWSLECMAKGGKMLYCGYNPGEEIKFVSPPFHTNEWEIIGCRAAVKEDLIQVIRLAELGYLKPVVSKVYKLEEANEAMKAIQRGEVLGRGVLKID